MQLCGKVERDALDAERGEGNIVTPSYLYALCNTITDCNLESSVAANRFNIMGAARGNTPPNARSMQEVQKPCVSHAFWVNAYGRIVH